jgi:hypothetical protein
MATWGSQTWGFANWGTLGDITVELSGQSLENQLGSVNTFPSIGWGALNWGSGEWGELSSPEAIITGQQLTTTVNTVNAFTDVSITLAGQEFGPIVIGDYVEGISVEADILGQQLNSTVNSVFGGEVVTVEVNSPSDDPWGNTRLGWGNGLWGNGDGITLLGNTTVEAQGEGNVTVTGQELQSNLGTAVLGVSILINVTGQELTSSEGDVFGGEVVEVQVRTASAQPWGETAWGDGQWGQSVGTDIAIGADAVLTPSVEVDLIGQQLTTTVNAISITADANVSLITNLLSISLGDENAFTDITVEVTGNNIGTIVIGDFQAGISQLIIPTGVTANTIAGTIGLNAWAVIDSGPSPTWTVVDKAA